VSKGAVTPDEGRAINGPAYGVQQVTQQRQAELAKDLGRVFRRQDILNLNTEEFASRVRVDGRLALSTGYGEFNLLLTPHDMRGSAYRAEEVGADGLLHTLAQGPLVTYRGQALGEENWQARFTITEERMEGAILTDTESYYLEPASRYSTSASGHEFVFYRAADLLAMPDTHCGVPLSGLVSEEAGRVWDKRSTVRVEGSILPDASSQLRVVEIATDADLAFVTKFGGSAAANNEILTVLNVVDGIYERELKLTFQVVYQHDWTTADPYTSTTLQDVLNDFKNYWNANLGVIHRDLAHLWTGRSFTGVAGYAYTGVVCLTPANSYGVTTYEPGNGMFVITAHEIGHNFSASHTDSVSLCDGSIMTSSETPDSHLTFCQFSRDQITNFANAHPGCLTQKSCSDIALSTTYQSFDVGGGTATVQVTASDGCPWIVANNAPWITLNPSRTNSGSNVLSLDVSANTGNAFRQSSILIGNQVFTIYQKSAVTGCVGGLRPVSWWRFEGDATDYAGPNDGVLVRSADFAPGKVGQALALNAVLPPQLVNAPTTGLPLGASDRSLELWFKVEAQGTFDCARLARYGGKGSGENYQLYTCKDNKIHFTQNDATLSGVLNDPASWHHIAVTTKGGESKLYLDGTLLDSGFLPLNTTSGSSMLIGSDDWKTDIDEVAVYNRALAQTEVSAIFNAGASGKCSLVANVISDAQTFVRQQYLDFLNREPDAGGLAYWTGQITKCGLDQSCLHDRRIGVADAFFFEAEFQQTGAYIYRVYKAALGQRPTYAQFTADRGKVTAGSALDQSKTTYAQQFVGTQDFLNLYPRALSDSQFLDALLDSVLQKSNVNLSAQRGSLLALLDGTDQGRAAVIKQVAESQPFVDAEYNNSFVLMEYFGYLHRDPDTGGFNFWLGKVNNFPPRDVSIQHAMACSFITSAEYQLRFGSVLISTNRDCPQ
jgi:hypothetical protein